MQKDSVVALREPSVVLTNELKEGTGEEQNEMSTSPGNSEKDKVLTN